MPPDRDANSIISDLLVWQAGAVLAVWLMIGAAPGCRDEPEPQSAPARLHDAQPPAPGRPSTSSPALDLSLDDPQKPSWLPFPRDIVGWVRTSNVRVVMALGTDASALSTLNHARLSRAVPAFATVSAATCRFSSIAPCPAELQAEAIILEAASSEDAYGLFTALMVRPPDTDVASVSGVNEDLDGYERFCWQGRYVILVRRRGQPTDQGRACIDRLAAGLAEPVPSDPLPAVFSYFPHELRLPGRMWFARQDLGQLPDEVRQGLLGGRHQEAGRLLGLGPQTSCAIVGYDPGEGEAPNYVWLVQYPDAQQAADAAQRCAAIVNARAEGGPGGRPPAPDLLIEGPVGCYLAGTWTPSQESLPNMHVLQRITERLPK